MRPIYLAAVASFATYITGQVQPNPITFLTQVSAAFPAISAPHSIMLSGTAQWMAGSLKKAGPVSLEAASDGSSTVNLSLEAASRIETRTALGDARACQWIDSGSVAHAIIGPDCSATVTWFEPLLFLQPTPALASVVTMSDDGLVSRAEGTYHQLSYTAVLQGKDATATKMLSAATQVKVLYDTATLLPVSMEYWQHPDGDLNTQLAVRVAYSNYQTISGLPVAYHIDRFVNNTLQLSITVDNANLK